jgi:hypothetical protein
MASSARVAEGRRRKSWLSENKGRAAISPTSITPSSVSWSAESGNPNIDVAERVARALGRKLSSVVAAAERGREE